MRSVPATAWAPRDVLRTTALIAGVYLGLQLVWVARSILLVLFLAVLLGLCLSAGVDFLGRWKLPRSAGAILIVIAVLGLFAGLLSIAAPRMQTQLQELKSQLPAAIDRVETWVGDRYGGVVEALTPPADSAAAAAAPATPALSLRRTFAEQVSRFGTQFFAAFSSGLAVLGGLILVLFVAIYIAVSPETYHAGLMHLFPHPMRARAGEVLHAIARMLRRWLVTQLVAMLVIGTVTTIVLLLLDVRAAIALGILAGLLEFMPYVGPILSAIPAIAMGFLSGPETAAYVAIAYTLIQQGENHLLIPLLMKRGLDLPPVVTIVSQAVMGLVFGFLGLLVAMPIVATASVMIRMLYVQDVVGDDVTVGGEPAAR